MEFIKLFTFSVNGSVKGSFLRSFTEITDKIFYREADIAEKKSKSRIYQHQLESRSHASTRLTSLSNHYHNHITRHHEEYTKASGDCKLQKKLCQELNQFTQQFPGIIFHHIVT
ncbi:hypothetical protein RhiirC2_794290 [Rhizophagus irregularis]|uniref:Uncharacterized protein n=1 Tax=Rhizophagus irregularis TaxID=588596 RepID=A0A2N1MDT4_9GLOM|nr:hypothetical protein RhiirC2_794290 [Rhizophagus irregularis]